MVKIMAVNGKEIDMPLNDPPDKELYTLDEAMYIFAEALLHPWPIGMPVYETDRHRITFREIRDRTSRVYHRKYEVVVDRIKDECGI